MKNPVAKAQLLTAQCLGARMRAVSVHRWRLLLAVLWLLPLGLVSAQSLPPRPNPPRLVNDLANLMQPGEADALERKLVAYNDSTSSQIAVVTVPSLDGDEIAD